jgi:hypothetical protein
MTGSVDLGLGSPRVVWTSWAHYSGGYQDRLLGGPLELLNLYYTTSVGVERKDYRGIVLDWEATHVRIHVKYS